MVGVSRPDDQLLIGEWACLGIVAQAPVHGYTVAARLKPDGDVGRVWSMSRALTYRALDQLVERGLLVEAGSEPGRAGGARTILSATRSGRARLRQWLTTPVPHRRDLRSELLLKLVLGRQGEVDQTAMLTEQQGLLERQLAAARVDLDAGGAPVDVVALWRAESTAAALRFVQLVADSG